MSFVGIVHDSKEGVSNASNVGTSLIKDPYTLKTLLAGPGVSISSSADSIVVGATLWTRLQATVTAAATGTIETVPLSSFYASKYLIEIRSSSENKFKSAEVWVSRKGASGVVSAVFARLGDAVNATVDWVVSGPNVLFQVHNGEVFDVEVTVTKLSQG